MKISTKTVLLDQLNFKPFLTAVVAGMRDGWYVFLGGFVGGFFGWGVFLNKMSTWAGGIEKGGIKVKDEFLEGRWRRGLPITVLGLEASYYLKIEKKRETERIKK